MKALDLPTTLNNLHLSLCSIFCIPSSLYIFILCLRHTSYLSSGSLFLHITSSKMPSLTTPSSNCMLFSLFKYSHLVILPIIVPITLFCNCPFSYLYRFFDDRNYVCCFTCESPVLSTMPDSINICWTNKSLTWKSSLVFHCLLTKPHRTWQLWKSHLSLYVWLTEHNFYCRIWPGHWSMQIPIYLPGNASQEKRGLWLY